MRARLRLTPETSAALAVVLATAMTCAAGSRIDPGDGHFIVLVDDGAALRCTNMEGARDLLKSPSARADFRPGEEDSVNGRLEATSWGLGVTNGTIYMGTVSIEQDAQGSIIELRCGDEHDAHNTFRYRVSGRTITPLARHWGPNPIVMLGSLAVGLVVGWVALQLLRRAGRATGGAA